jgi:hypothetical protein
MTIKRTFAATLLLQGCWLVAAAQTAAQRHPHFWFRRALPPDAEHNFFVRVRRKLGVCAFLTYLLDEVIQKSCKSHSETC